MLDVDRSREGVAVLAFDRPDRLNALPDPGDGAAVREVCEALNADETVRCVILTGKGRAFSAGGDLKAMAAREGLFEGDGLDIRRRYRREVHAVVRALYDLEAPLIAAVNGPAVGLGCDIACLADMRVASEAARFGVSFLKLGLIPGDGGAWILPRTVGHARAAEMLFTGELIDARTALAWGLVNRVVAEADLMAAALALAETVAAQPARPLRLAKSLLRQGRELPYEALLELSASVQALCHLTDDHAEGVAARLAKREPRFTGR